MNDDNIEIILKKIIVKTFYDVVSDLDESIELGDDACIRFEKIGNWSAPDIARYAINYWNEIFHENIDYDISPKAELIYGALAQCQYGSFAAVAAAIGVHPRALEDVAHRWLDKQFDLPPSVTLEEFYRLCKLEEKRYEGRDS